jgi:hypothetical protein
MAISINLFGILYAILSIGFGLLVIFFPKLIRYVIGAYFILTGLLALAGILF